MLTRDEMLSVAMASNGEFDRQFITGVLTTGIYCLPSCRARKPKPENIQFFETIAAAQQAGLRACKKCKPDNFFAGIDEDLEKLENAVEALRREPGRYATIADLAESSQFGQSKLFQLVRRHYHTTPAELLFQARVKAACGMLLETENAVSEIAFEVGFETLSTFYEHFGRLTGMTPTSYRKLPNLGAFQVALPPKFHRDVLLSYYGRDPESVSENVTERTLTIAANLQGRPSLLRLELGDSVAECSVTGATSDVAHSAVIRILGLAQDPDGFELTAQKLDNDHLIQRVGLRIPLTATLYDGIVWAILGQQVNLRFAYTLRRRLIETYGTPLSCGLIAPPTPAIVGGLAVDQLLPLQFSRKKAEYLIDVSRMIANGDLDLERLSAGTATRAESTFLKVRGFGPWSTHYLMMRAFGFSDCYPLGDTGITAALQRFFALAARPDAAQTKALLEPFSPHRSLACFHLWQSLKFEP